VDVLSEVLADLRLESTLYAALEGSAPWAVDYPGGSVAGFHLVTEGRCILELEGAAPLVMGPGDFVVLPHGAPHRLRSLAGGAAPARIEELVDGASLAGEPVRVGSGGERASYLCGAFYFAEAEANPFLAALPAVIHVPSDNGRVLPWLEMHLRFVSCEARSGRPGWQMVLARLSDVLFVQAVRAQLAEMPEDAAGWLGAMRDPQIGRALGLIHRHPERPWSVASLAAAVFMSRSVFAERFTRLVGQPPLTYLSSWRMHRAARMLRGGSDRLTTVAGRLGYGSEAAFSTAFRRHFGTSPGAYRRGSHRDREARR
jgi:AraC-like DNA-binding protein